MQRDDVRLLGIKSRSKLRQPGPDAVAVQLHNHQVVQTDIAWRCCLLSTMTPPVPTPPASRCRLRWCGHSWGGGGWTPLWRVSRWSGVAFHVTGAQQKQGEVRRLSSPLSRKPNPARCCGNGGCVFVGALGKHCPRRAAQLREKGAPVDSDNACSSTSSPSKLMQRIRSTIAYSASVTSKTSI